MDKHNGYINSLIFTPDGKNIISGSWDTTIRLWELSHHLETTVLDGHTLSVNDIVLSPTGETLASASWDRTIRLWNYKDDSSGTPS